MLLQLAWDYEWWDLRSFFSCRPEVIEVSLGCRFGRRFNDFQPVGQRLDFDPLR